MLLKNKVTYKIQKKKTTKITEVDHKGLEEP